MNSQPFQHFVKNSLAPRFYHINHKLGKTRRVPRMNRPALTFPLWQRSQIISFKEVVLSAGEDLRLLRIVIPASTIVANWHKPSLPCLQTNIKGSRTNFQRIAATRSQNSLCLQPGSANYFPAVFPRFSPFFKLRYKIATILQISNRFQRFSPATLSSTSEFCKLGPIIILRQLPPSNIADNRDSGWFLSFSSVRPCQGSSLWSRHTSAVRLCQGCSPHRQRACPRHVGCLHFLT